LTNTGRATHAAISPDGKYVAYVERSPDGPSVWVRQVAATNGVQVVTPAERQYIGLTFSPDANFIYFVVREAPVVTEGALYRVPTMGGRSERLLTRISSAVTFSPDGSAFAYVRKPQTGPGSMIVVTLDLARKGIVATRILAEGAFTYTTTPAWSPDGALIVCTANTRAIDSSTVRLIGVRVADGRQLPVTRREWRHITRVAWLGDGRGLLMNAGDQMNVGQIWYVSFPSGRSERITRDAMAYASVTITSDSKVAAAILEDSTSTVWVAEHGAPGRQITFGKYDGRYGVAWAPDGRIVYTSMESGNDDIWMMNRDGSGRSQLTTNQATDDKATVSPDGRYIVFNSDRAGGFDLWRMDIDGENQTRLTRGIRVRTHQFTPDSRFVIASGSARLWKVAIDGGGSEPLTEGVAFSPALTPDGTLIAACARADLRAPPRLAILPVSGGHPMRLFEAGCHPFDTGAIRWTMGARSRLR
jgi:Tol biopolymer transport system component